MALTNRADIAVVVADEWQRQGVAMRMLSSLEALARSAGINIFTATVQADNQPALRLLHRFNPSARATFSGGDCDFTLPIRS